MGVGADEQVVGDGLSGGSDADRILGGKDGDRIYGSSGDDTPQGDAGCPDAAEAHVRAPVEDEGSSVLHAGSLFPRTSSRPAPRHRPGCS